MQADTPSDFEKCEQATFCRPDACCPDAWACACEGDAAIRVCLCNALCPPSWRSVSIENGFGHAAALEKRETEQNGISDTCPKRRANVALDADVLHKNGIDTNAHHDQKRLKTEGKQGAEIVLPHLTPLAIDHSSHGNRRDGGNHVDLDHTPIGNDKDADAQCPGDDANQGGLEPQPKQRANLHFHEPRLNVAHQCADIHRRVADDHAGGLIDHMLG